MIKNHQLGFLFALESNRLVSVEKGSWVQVQTLDIPNNGQLVWLRDFGRVKLFRTYLKNQVRHDIIHLPDEDNTDDGVKYDNVGQPELNLLHDQHWQIEPYHRTLKQVCHIESFQVRGQVAVKNHLFAAICGYAKLQQMRATDVIKNCYRLQRDLFNQVITDFITIFAPGMKHMNLQFCGAVNV